MDPKVELKAAGNVLRRHEFVLTGGTVAANWGGARLRGEEPWCNLGVWDLGGPGEHVGSYGGSVWPLAWPHWFVSLPSSAQFGSGGVALTEAGRVALLVAAAGDVPADGERG